MQHAINQCYECMRAIKDRIARPASQLAIISIEPLYHAQQVSRWKSSVHDLQDPSAHHSSVVFRHDKSVDHHSDDSVGLFRHNKSVGQYNVALNQVINQSVRLNIYLATGSSNHRLVAPSNATAETNSQHSKMLTNTCRSLVDPRISAPAASSNHSKRNYCQQITTPGKSARAEELLQREERLAQGAHLGRGRIFMLEQTKNQLVKDKPAGQNLQEQTVKEDLSSEDDEGQLERRSVDKSKLEEFLKSCFKREEKKRSLNSVKEQPAQTKTSSKQMKLMNRLASWLKSNQLR
ncbi:hypothetical protein F511_37185 [Dorcoceras hygrometricum]|uniref:Uncharacterized protein n=1 Tax=Dorcoceras hygrometricum TaxID=472368 RepID=A0A2Z7AWW8_9LAMI|nr:hypothetical protein F511_37185 [Dorcoceras hygrometricum]